MFLKCDVDFFIAFSRNAAGVSYKAALIQFDDGSFPVL